MSLIHFLSSERLEAYRCAPGDPESQLLAKYLWNIALCEACYPILSLFEVALRNAVDHVFVPAYGQGWLDECSPILKMAEKTEITKHKQKLGAKRSANRNQLIGSLTLGFWTGLFRREYAPLWPPHLKEIFPYLATMNRTPQFIFHRLGQIRLFRNRVFHHEPIWHWPNLLQRYQEIQETMDWLSPELKNLLSKVERFQNVYKTGPEVYVINNEKN